MGTARFATLVRSSTTEGWQPGEKDIQYFVDVDMENQDNHHNEVLWLASKGISEGWYDQETGTREFRGLSDVMRCDMAAFINRMDKLR